MYQNCNSEEILTETTKSISLKELEVIVSSQDVAMNKEGTTSTASAPTFPEYHSGPTETTVRGSKLGKSFLLT